MRAKRYVRRRLAVLGSALLLACGVASATTRAAVAAGVMQDGMQAATSPDMTPTPPPGSGPEYTSYGDSPSLRNRFLVGGLLAWLGILMGGLLMLDRRRMAALAIGGGAMAAGIALMLSEVI